MKNEKLTKDQKWMLERSKRTGLIPVWELIAQLNKNSDEINKKNYTRKLAKERFEMILKLALFENIINNNQFDNKLKKYKYILDD